MQQKFIGGGGVDTERGLHFNYFHQSSRTSYKELSCADKAQYKQQPFNFIHTTIQPVCSCCHRAPPPSLWSCHHCRGAGAIVVDKPPLSSGRRHHRGATAIIVEPSLSWSRCHCCGVAAFVVEPPPSLRSSRNCCGAATIAVEPPPSL